MAFNGSGTFNRLYDWTTDRDASVNIRADKMDDEMDGFATGLSTCITKDGQTTLTADIPMSTYKLTGLGAGSANGHSVRYEQVVLNSGDNTITNTDADALAGPILDLFRNSASPADNDIIGEIQFNGEDDGSNKTQYAAIRTTILDVTGGTEDGQLTLAAMVGASLTDALHVAQGIWTEGQSDPGAGDIAAAQFWVADDISHVGDSDNKIAFGTDTQDFQTGGSSRMDLSDSGVRLGGANARVTTVLDEDAMGSDSATALATQQSIKAYVDSQAAVSGGAQDLWIDAGAMISRSTNGAASGLSESSTNKIMSATFDFDAGTDEFVQARWVPPKRYNGGTMTARFHWEGGAAGDVIWGIQAVFIRNDDAIDTAFGTAVTVTDTLTATTDIMVSDESAAFTPGGTAADYQVVVFQIYRDADAAGDTMTGDAKLHGVEITWTSDAGSDA